MSSYEMTFDGVKVTIRRERGDDFIRAVIGEAPFSLVAWSYPANTHQPERREFIDRPPGDHNGWSPDAAKKWADLLHVGVHVMKHLHEEGLKYDKVVARRKGKK